MLYRLNEVISIPSLKGRFYAKSTDLQWIYGCDQEGERLQYYILTTEVFPAEMKNYGKCGPGYNIEGQYVPNLSSGSQREGITPDQWTLTPRIYRLFILALINPHVGGDECLKMLNLYGFHLDVKLKKSYIGSLHIIDGDGCEITDTRILFRSIKKNNE